MDFSQKLSGFVRNGSARQAHLREVLSMNPYEATKMRVKEKLERDVEYRTTILKGVKTLQGLSSEELRLACESMEEREWKDGEDIIRQGDKGDSLFLLKEGSVVVSRKNNPRDKSEKPIILAKLPKNTCFGEIALLTEEPRSATITAIGPCVTVQMMKSAFDGILAASNEKHSRARQAMGSLVIDSVPLFKTLSKDYKRTLLSLMVPVSYPIGSYICRQGGVGNSFFIIVEGLVKCTISNEESEEMEVARLGPGSFFGEAALLDPSSIRSANIISTEITTCLSLSREHFSDILRDIKAAEIKANIEMYGSRSTRGGSQRRGAKGSRLVTGMNAKTMQKTPAMHSLVPRMARFLSEALYCSMYAKLYRHGTLRPASIEEYGQCLWKVLHRSPARAEAVHEIRNEFLAVAQIPSPKRTEQQHAFVCGLMRQQNKLRSVLCADWLPFQYTELSKSCRFKTYKPLESIMEVATEGTTMYLILRGAVRLWKGTQKSNLVHEEDLASGDYFGEAAMDGEHKRSCSARAMTTVDVAIIEEKDFFEAQNRGLAKQSTQDKFNFLRKLQVFRHTDDSVLTGIAHVMQQKVYTRNQLLLKPDMVHDDLVFVYRGTAEVVCPLRSDMADADVPLNCVPFACIQENEFFGESGFINNKDPTVKVRESHHVVSSTVMHVLVLKPSFFHLLGPNVVSSIRSAKASKAVFRNQRLQELQQERQQVHSCRVTMKKEGQSLRPMQGEAPRPATAHMPPTDLRSSSPLNTRVNPQTDSVVLPAVTTSRHNPPPFDMEDIPVLVNKHYDPFMVIDAAPTDRDQKSKRFMLSLLNRPRLIRSRGRDARASCEPGYMAQALAAAGVNATRPKSGHVGADVARARYDAQRSMTSHTHTSHAAPSAGTSKGLHGHDPALGERKPVSALRRAGTWQGSWLAVDGDDDMLTVATGLPPLSAPTQGSLFSLADVEFDNGSYQSQGPVSRPRSNHAGGAGSLRGSSHIPSAMSYADASAVARSRPDTGHKRRTRAASPLTKSSVQRPGTAPG